MVQVNEENNDKNLITLHRDMDLQQKSNDKFDLNFQRGDIVIDQGLNSLSNGIIIACLTGWNELKRSKNTVYYDYGNHAYELKANKSNLVYYKVEQYFRKCLNNMRRVKTINNLVVTDIEYGYKVYFNVTSLNDEIVNGEFNFSSNYGKLKTNCNVSLPIPSTSPYTPLTFTVTLTDELGVAIPNQICYIYIDGKFVGATIETNDDGQVNYNYYPKYLNPSATLQVKFKGNNEYNPTTSPIFTFESMNWMFKVDNEENLKVISLEGTEIPEIFLTSTGELHIKDDESRTYKLNENGDVICQI